MNSETEPAGVTSSAPAPEVAPLDLSQLEQRYFAFARPGEVVFLECSQNWTMDQTERISKMISAAMGDSRVHAVLLPVGVRVARVDVAEG